MRSGAAIKILLGVVVVALTFGAAGAAAATPKQILNDLADNGRLDGKYSTADLERALGNLTGQGYSRPAVQTPLAQQVAKQKRQALGEAQRSGSLPFTGAELTVLTVGGFLLLLAGAGLRRAARQRG